MKSPLVFILPILLFAACSSSKNTAGNESVQLNEATYFNWTAGAPDDNNTFERGTDFILTFSNWPAEYTPVAVIFNNKISFPADVEKTENNRAVINARIIHESSVFAEVSENTRLSDRITFILENGESSYLEINNWVQLSDQYY